MAGREDFIENCVTEVMTIYERILSVPSLAHIIVEQDKRDGQNSLWKNIGNLVVLESKTADQEERKWVMDSLEDYQTNHRYKSSDLSKHFPTGRQESRGHHSLFDIQVQGPPGLGE